MSYFQNNLQVLKEKYNIDLCEQKKDELNYFIEKCKDGYYGIRINRDDKWTYLGSKYNQSKDINKLVESLEVKHEGDNIIILGFGLGYHLREVLKCIGNNKLIVLETDVQLIKYASEIQDLTDVLNDDRLKIYIFKNEDDIKRIITNNLNLHYTNNIKVASYSNYNKIYNEAEMAVKTIDDAATLMIINNNTYLESAEEYVKCYLKNIPYMIKGYNFKSLMTCLKGKPAVVVSAGPSLSKNIEFLKEYQDKVFIICGIRNAKSLIERGITPHLVCVIDYSDIMYKFGECAFDKKIPFAILDHANYRVSQNNKGKNFFCSSMFLNNLKKLTGIDFYKPDIGGSVAHLCIDLALYVGCNNIIFIGQDLAYTDNKVHADIAAYEKNNISDYNFINSIYVEGNYEERVLSSLAFNTFKIQIEGIIENNPNTTFINCTEGGAKIKGTKIKKLKDTLNELCMEDIYPEKILEEASLKKEEFDRDILVKNLKEMKKELDISKELYMKGIKLVNNLKCYFHGKNDSNINKTLEQLQEIEKTILSQKLCNDLLGYLQYSYVDDLNKNIEYKELVQDTDFERGIKLAKKAEKLYEALLESTDKLKLLVDECISSIKNYN